MDPRGAPVRAIRTDPHAPRKHWPETCCPHKTMPSPDRIDQIRVHLRERRLDLLVCALPANVLMLSGYWPVIGTGLALAFADGRIVLLVPEDEADLTRTGWADEMRTFRPGSLDRLETVEDAVREPLSRIVGSAPARIGFEGCETSEPAPYSAMHLYSGSMPDLLANCFPRAALIRADATLADLRARKSPVEIERIRIACGIAGKAFEAGVASIKADVSEIEAANAFRSGLSQSAGDHRCDGFAWCMSGANSALAAGAYARSRSKRIETGDLVLVHCNSYADGYWTDITRTFCAGTPDDRQANLFAAVFEARQAALSLIRPGVAAAAVDKAAREVLRDRGFGAAFKHSTGHGVGFGAISAEAHPRLHPKSPDVLETGMVFNVEPAVYFDNYGGIRHCDMVAVHDNGYELLTPFQREPWDSGLHRR